MTNLHPANTPVVIQAGMSGRGQRFAARWGELLFVVYHDAKLTPMVPHSLGLQKGLIGVAHVFAAPEQSAENLVVIAHEVMHTVGATDKYDPATNLPVFPDGYADPQLAPLLPQSLAELMAGRIAVSSTEAQMPRGLGAVLVGHRTAAEIGWVR